MKGREDVLSLAQGIVHWSPPDAALEAAMEALRLPGSQINQWGASQTPHGSLLHPNPSGRPISFSVASPVPGPLQTQAVSLRASHAASSSLPGRPYVCLVLGGKSISREKLQTGAYGDHRCAKLLVRGRRPCSPWDDQQDGKAQHVPPSRMTPLRSIGQEDRSILSVF